NAGEFGDREGGHPLFHALAPHQRRARQDAVRERGSELARLDEPLDPVLVGPSPLVMDAQRRLPRAAPETPRERRPGMRVFDRNPKSHLWAQLPANFCRSSGVRPLSPPHRSRGLAPLTTKSRLLAGWIAAFGGRLVRAIATIARILVGLAAELVAPSRC